MKAISDLANVLKRKPMVTAQQEQEICNLTRLIEATSIHGTLPRVTIRNKDATISRVPEMEQYTLGRKDLQRSIPQGDSSQQNPLRELPQGVTLRRESLRKDNPSKESSQTKETATSRVRQTTQTTSQQPRTRAAIAKNAALNAPLASRTRSKTIGTTSAVHKRFTHMENEVHRALEVMDKDTGKLLNYCQLLRHPKIQKSVEHIGRKQIWSISARSWRTNQRIKHHILHP
jgi:hypothetical protein